MVQKCIKVQAKHGKVTQNMHGASRNYRYVWDVSRTCLPNREKEKNKEVNTSYDEPKRHIVLSGKKDILGLEGKTDKSEDYEKFHEIPPFKVKADPSILLRDEDYPWLWRNKQSTQVKKK